MKTTNNNSFVFRGSDSIKSVNEASYLFGRFVCEELEKIGMRSSYRHVMQPLMENDSLTQLELVKAASEVCLPTRAGKCTQR